MCEITIGSQDPRATRFLVNSCGTGANECCSTRGTKGAPEAHAIVYGIMEVGRASCRNILPFRTRSHRRACGRRQSCFLRRHEVPLIGAFLQMDCRHSVCTIGSSSKGKLRKGPDCSRLKGDCEQKAPTPRLSRHASCAMWGIRSSSLRTKFQKYYSSQRQ